MKVSKQKKNYRVAEMREIRVGLLPACPNCGQRGSHFFPSFAVEVAPGMIWTEPGEYVCQRLNPCPKCGQENGGEDIQTPVAENADVIRCWNCGAETEGHEPGTGRHREAWNRGEVFLHNVFVMAAASLR